MWDLTVGLIQLGKRNWSRYLNKSLILESDLENVSLHNIITHLGSYLRLITPMSGSGIFVYFSKGLFLLFLVYFILREIR